MMGDGKLYSATGGAWPVLVQMSTRTGGPSSICLVVVHYWIAPLPAGATMESRCMAIRALFHHRELDGSLSTPHRHHTTQKLELDVTCAHNTACSFRVSRCLNRQNTFASTLIEMDWSDPRKKLLDDLARITPHCVVDKPNILSGNGSKRPLVLISLGDVVDMVPVSNDVVSSSGPCGCPDQALVANHVFAPA